MCTHNFTSFCSSYVGKWGADRAVCVTLESFEVIYKIVYKIHSTCCFRILRHVLWCLFDTEK